MGGAGRGGGAAVLNPNPRTFRRLRPHVHLCPECNEVVRCTYRFCALEWKQRLDDGRACSAFVVCSCCTGDDPREPLGSQAHTLAGGW